ncbi:hypothetical protein Slin_3355 [Spirosoma linguale DSM 74]|uniref:Uncharacterized protein n=1 Tax=Spirosoma linguale (strain ATCC 33905 / DSM 74 / LMG 10896 / Claus 1) TaxID=504472 RepID=D2QP57_SPILD|nr:hypothetical protein Slin_3355 [Spirosoma linguale DSM 74]
MKGHGLTRRCSVKKVRERDFTTLYQKAKDCRNYPFYCRIYTPSIQAEAGIFV